MSKLRKDTKNKEKLAEYVRVTDPNRTWDDLHCDKFGIVIEDINASINILKRDWTG
jgi:hypothetical protein